MTVAELAEWLKTFPDPGATVEVVVHERGTGYCNQGGTAHTAPFNPEQHTEYIDMRGNRFVKPGDSYYNRRTLLLGVSNG